MNNKVLGAVNAFQYAAILVQAEQVFKWIQLGLAILCSGVLLAYRIWCWYKKAKEDGKITKEEVAQGIEIVKEGIEDIKSNLDKTENKD